MIAGPCNVSFQIGLDRHKFMPSTRASFDGTSVQLITGGWIYEVPLY